MTHTTQTTNVTFLRRVLVLDAASCIGMGVLVTAGTGYLESLLGLPAPLLRTTGASLLPFAGVLIWLATRSVPPRAGVIAVIVCNAVWVIDSLALLASGWLAPTALGTAFILAQAAAVAVLAVLEYVGLKR
jgi:hypothetical protein